LHATPLHLGIDADGDEQFNLNLQDSWFARAAVRRQRRDAPADLQRAMAILRAP